MPEALYDIGRQTVADAEQILRGLPPVLCRRAQRETIGRSRSKPISKSAARSKQFRGLRRAVRLHFRASAMQA